MKNMVFLFVGFILLAVAGIIFWALGSDSAVITLQGRSVTDGSVRTIVKYSVSGFLAGLGAFFGIIGLLGRSRDAKASQQKILIMQNGVETEGKLTFVDKNYSFLVNGNPIFSIVEYRYQDKSGNEYNRRVNNISTEIVIRNQFQVGAIVAIKYLDADPSQSVILLQEAAKQPSTLVTCKYCSSKFSLTKHDKCPKCGAS